VVLVLLPAVCAASILAYGGATSIAAMAARKKEQVAHPQRHGEKVSRAGRGSVRQARRRRGGGGVQPMTRLSRTAVERQRGIAVRHSAR